MKALALEKFERIETRLKIFPEDTKSARIVLNTAPNGRYEAKANVSASGFDYHSEEIDFSLDSALIRTVEGLLRMMEKDKEKWERWERDVRDAKRFDEEEAEVVENL